MKKCRYCGAEPRFDYYQGGFVYLGCQETRETVVRHDNEVKIRVTRGATVDDVAPLLIKEWNKGN